VENVLDSEGDVITGTVSGNASGGNYMYKLTLMRGGTAKDLKCVWPGPPLRTDGGGGKKSPAPA
jgi:hypothetical protein